MMGTLGIKFLHPVGHLAEARCGEFALDHVACDADERDVSDHIPEPPIETINARGLRHVRALLVAYGEQRAAAWAVGLPGQPVREICFRLEFRRYFLASRSRSLPNSLLKSARAGEERLASLPGFLSGLVFGAMVSRILFPPPLGNLGSVALLPCPTIGGGTRPASPSHTASASFVRDEELARSRLLLPASATLFLHHRTCPPPDPRPNFQPMPRGQRARSGRRSASRPQP